MKKILVPTDYSACSIQALGIACEIAKRAGVEIVLLNTYSLFIPTNEIPMIPHEIDLIEEENKKALKSLADEYIAKHGIKIETVTNTSSLTFAIEELVKDTGVDFIVMGMRGRSEFAKQLLGSNTFDVIDARIAPVLAIPEGYNFKGFNLVCFATLIEEEKEIIYNPLLEMVKLFQSKLDIFKVVEPVEVHTFDSDLKNTAIDRVFKNVSYEYHFPESMEPLQGIERYITIKQPDMICMLPHKHNFFVKLFTSGNTQKVVYHTKIPLLALV